MLRLLSIGDRKTVKNKGQGYLTGQLYLAPHTLGGGPTLCPHSTPGCRAVCLFTSGFGAFPMVQEARIRRTRLFLDAPQLFLELLHGDLAWLPEMARTEELKPSARLNGTSDIDWENLDESLFLRHGAVQFYDYTKIPSRMERFLGGDLPPNYHLSFSITPEKFGSPVYLRQIQDFLWKGGNCTFVYQMQGVPVASQFEALIESQFQFPDLPFQIVDGDEDDCRFLQKGVLIALSAKGEARTSDSEFVVRPKVQMMEAVS